MNQYRTFKYHVNPCVGGDSYWFEPCPFTPLSLALSQSFKVTILKPKKEEKPSSKSPLFFDWVTDTLYFLIWVSLFPLLNSFSNLLQQQRKPKKCTLKLSQRQMWIGTRSGSHILEFGPLICSSFSCHGSLFFLSLVVLLGWLGLLSISVISL